MNISDLTVKSNELPLDTLVTNGGFCGIFRRIACIGDSLSSGEFESMDKGQKGYHDMFDYSWGQYLARDCGCTVFNLSRGGMSAKEYCESFAEASGFYGEEYVSQAYIIALGVNDVSHVLANVIEFGDINDVFPNEPEKNAHTFAGYYGKIISDYKRLQPKAKFFLMTCPSDNDDPKRSALYDRHAELIYEFCRVFDNCYALDLRKYAPAYDEAFRKRFYLGGHLNAAGYRLTALMVESYIDYIIRSAPDDFKQVSFIGTPFHNEAEKW